MSTAPNMVPRVPLGFFTADTAPSLPCGCGRMYEPPRIGGEFFDCGCCEPCRMEYARIAEAKEALREQRVRDWRAGKDTDVARYAKERARKSAFGPRAGIEEWRHEHTQDLSPEGVESKQSRKVGK